MRRNRARFSAGKGNHSADECKKIQDQTKRLKAEHHGGNAAKDSKSSDKAWTRKASNDEKKTKSDLAAFVQKETEKARKKGVKELAALGKKHKSSSDDDLSDDDLNF